MIKSLDRFIKMGFVIIGYVVISFLLFVVVELVFKIN